MTTFLYELPTTGAISFADFCVDRSLRNSYTTHIANATQSRANLRGVLKENKRTDGEKDYLKIVKILDDYVPQLCSIISCAAHDEISLQTEPVFSWRSTLSAHIINSSPRVFLPSLHAEYAYALLTYAFSLSNLARSSVASLGPYEHDRAISDVERKSKDEKLNHAITFLCRASGIFSFISETVLPRWRGSRDGNLSGFSLPPDLSTEVNGALSKLSLADAQSLAIRKLLSKSAYDSNITPGPPLPTSHPSPALIAKLHLECGSLYSSARSLAKTPGSTGDTGGVSVALRRYLADEYAYHSALAHKWLGVDAGEFGGTAKGGDAVGFLAWAKKELEDLKDGGKGIGITRGEKEKIGRTFTERKGCGGTRERQHLLHFQPVPPQADLQARIPAGRLAVAVKAYTQPSPIFGPGSTDYIQRQTEEIDLALAEKSLTPVGDNLAEPSAATYAGAGSYF
ncbi:BRO1-like domain-containing protein [Armillaria novae-zelandiae]|uniref:pH-response regulator protein palC n=1 Tax=Armillaria novae-zelandiae TaxID=153914 RepID=A0AA39UC05_9AGAR|nr:BRO1-like domain-containing protein [Armillaria novae-zelandiae]